MTNQLIPVFSLKIHRGSESFVDICHLNTWFFLHLKHTCYIIHHTFLFTGLYALTIYMWFIYYTCTKWVHTQVFKCRLTLIVVDTCTYLYNVKKWSCNLCLFAFFEINNVYVNNIMSIIWCTKPYSVGMQAVRSTQ